MSKTLRAALTLTVLSAAFLLGPSPATSVLPPICDPPGTTCEDVQFAFFLKKKANGNCLYKCIEGPICTNECTGDVLNFTTTSKVKVFVGAGECNKTEEFASEACFGGAGEPTTEE